MPTPDQVTIAAALLGVCWEQDAVDADVVVVVVARRWQPHGDGPAVPVPGFWLANVTKDSGPYDFVTVIDAANLAARRTLGTLGGTWALVSFAPDGRQTIGPVQTC